MTVRIEFRPEAERDLREAVVWYENERRGLGRALEGEVDRTVRRIAENPHQYAEIEPTVRRALTRRFPYGIYFRLQPEVATVLAVLHLRRHPETWRRPR